MTGRGDKILNEEIIAGFFREALFHSRTVQFSYKEKNIELQILDVMEESTRNSTSERNLKFKKPADSDLPGIEDCKLEFYCAFPHFVARWHGSVISAEGGAILLKMPTTLTIENQRASKRIEAQHLLSGLVPVLIARDECYFGGYFKIEDYSADGCGGLLTTKDSLILESGTQIQGQFDANGISYRVDGIIAQCHLLKAPAAPDDSFVFRVGLTRTRTSSKEYDGIERRRGFRVQTVFSVSLISPLNPEHPMEFEIRSASVSGYSGSLRDPSNKHLLPQGLTLKHLDDSMRAEVISQEGENIRLQFVDGGSEDRLKWLGQLCKSRPDLSLSMGTGQDLIDLFCQSGAFSSKFIAGQSRSAYEIVQGIASSKKHEGFVHRWVERNSTGEIKGHSSAIRYADQLWHIGDIAGMRDPEKKISKDFIPAFFRHFQSYCLTLSPCPRVVISWSIDHPFWKKFDEHLTPLTTDVLSINAHYLRLKSELQKLPDHWNFESVPAHDHQSIRRIENRLLDNNHRALLSALDFCPERFGSPILQNIVRRGGGTFKREYVHASSRDSEFLVVFSLFPEGTCPQRSVEVPWIFPLGSETFELEDLALGLKVYGLKSGFKFPGVLLPSYDSFADSSATKLMKWTLGHPGVLDFWKDK